MSEDEQEAFSIKYNIARIVRLTSGRYAVFAPWSNEGMPCIKIGSYAEVEPFILSADECSEWCDSITPVHEAKPSKINLAAALGIKKPTVTIERRL